MITNSGTPVQVIPTYPEVGYGMAVPPPGQNIATGVVPVAGNNGDPATPGPPPPAPAPGQPGGVILASNYSADVGTSVGSGECVALVQATSDVGLTKTWVPGTLVQGNTSLTPGTVIATFGSDGSYTNTYGQSHAAIYLGQNATGVQVEDQYLGQPAYTHTINWTTGISYEAGNKFYVVSH